MAAKSAQQTLSDFSQMTDVRTLLPFIALGLMAALATDGLVSDKNISPSYLLNGTYIGWKS